MLKRGDMRRMPGGRSVDRIFRAARRAFPRGPEPVILMYHRIERASFDPWGLTVRPERFAAQLRWLTASRTVLPLCEFAERHSAGRLMPADAAITFDDGYSSVVAAAALLEKYRLPATIFLPVQLNEKGAPFWWDEIQLFVFGFSGRSLRLDGAEVDLGEPSTSDADWPPFTKPRTPRQSAFQRLWTMLRHRPPVELAAAMDELRDQVGSVRWRNLDLPMAPQQVRGIASQLVQFGSHTLAHSSLPTLGRAEKVNEIRNSIERVQSLTGTAPLSFAYPYGDHDEESEAIVREAGFFCACATGDRPVSSQSSLFALPRVGVGDWTEKRLGPQLARA